MLVDEVVGTVVIIVVVVVAVVVVDAAVIPSGRGSVIECLIGTLKV